MAEASMDKLFRGMPGHETLSRLMMKRIRKELDELDEGTLSFYMGMLGKLASAVQTGEGFEELMRDGE